MKSPRTRKLDSKILSATALARKISSKRRGQKYVFTNGCFDILHAGHVTYLQQARAQGTQLIVALNDDASVRRLKGASRPINLLKDRLQVIAALESVDYVTWFAGDTALPEIKKIAPDVLVKGGDWPVDQIVGAREVLGWGGEVKSLAFVRGRSTTRIIKKAQIK